MQSAQHFFTNHSTPSSFLQAALPHLLCQQRKFNVILPHAQKLQAQERLGHQIAPNQFWIIGWSIPSPSNPTPTLEFVLSCTEHHLGTYPLFLVLSRDIPSLSDAWIDAQMDSLALKLSNLVDPTRVFSIFGQEKPTQALCHHWSRHTGANILSQPYYEASSSYCTKNTFVKKEIVLGPGHEMRLAKQSDAHSVAQLCREFADDSVCPLLSATYFRLMEQQPPFTLTPERAHQEAQYMITHGLVSVYTIGSSDSCSPRYYPLLTIQPLQMVRSAL